MRGEILYLPRCSIVDSFEKVWAYWLINYKETGLLNILVVGQPHKNVL